MDKYKTRNNLIKTVWQPKSKVKVTKHNLIWKLLSMCACRSIEFKVDTNNVFRDIEVKNNDRQIDAQTSENQNNIPASSK